MPFRYWSLKFAAPPIAIKPPTARITARVMKMRGVASSGHPGQQHRKRHPHATRSIKSAHGAISRHAMPVVYRAVIAACDTSLQDRGSP